MKELKAGGRFIIAVSFLFSLSITLTAVSVRAESPALEQVSLDEAVCLAMQKNPTILAEEEELRKARLNITRAYAVAMPKVSSQLSASYDDAFTHEHSYGFSIGLSQPIYSQGKAGILKKQADINISKVQSQLLSTSQQVLFQTLRAFYGILKTKETLVITEEALSRLQEHLRVIQLRFEVGQVPETDILRVEAELASAEKDVIEARNNVKLAKEELKRYIGLKTPVEVIPPPSLQMMVIDEESSLMKTALDHRHDLRQVRLAQQFAQEGVRLARADFFPKLSLRINYIRNEDRFFPDERGMQYSGELEIPLFEGGLRFAQVKEANLEFRKVQLSLEELERDVHLQVTQASLDLDKVQASMKATEKEIASAEENLRRVTLQYREGLASNLDVIDANTLLVRAKTMYSSLNYDQAIAYFQLLSAIGCLDVNQVRKSYPSLRF
ncbi:MAG: TolC family protein [bacterium]